MADQSGRDFQDTHAPNTHSDAQLLEEMEWYLERAMLRQAQAIAARYAGKGELWQRPYALARPRDASALASVWFTAYPASIITRPGASVLQTLGDPALWEAFAAIGIQAVHTGPMKIGGGVRGRAYTPTIDGNFDRIGLELDAQFGTLDEFQAMSRHAHEHGAIIIDDIIPGHTGKGPDFRLAERGVGEYPGLYHMVEIAPGDWGLLPDIPAGEDSANLSPAIVDQLAAKGYLVGQLPRTIFYEPGVKETDWSATASVTGPDGVTRRWVYLHYFKAGQPTLNWLDPSFAAPRLVLGDALHALDTLGARMLRLDANGFLGIERTADVSDSPTGRSKQRVWSEGHPLSVTANQLIAGLVRKAGGFTFQELNLAVDDIAAMSQGGADLAYDFITRPAYQHALVTGDAEFLRLMLRTVHEFGLDPAALIHALQNHDELTLELVHFWTQHAADVYTFQGRELTGAALRDSIRATMYERLTGTHAPYNRRFVTNGVACTTASLIAATLDIADLDTIGDEERAAIQRCHLLLCMYNALQPGIFALSGWDLVGALTLPAEAVAEHLADGDTRWINRGAYDLMGVNPGATHSSAGLPRARALYGSLPQQLAEPDSFLRQLQRVLAVRERWRIYQARQVAIPSVQAPGLVVMVHELPDGMGTEITALNFGAEAARETVALPDTPRGALVDLLTEQEVGEISAEGAVEIALAGHTGAAYLIQTT
jgi:trehalose synthase